MNKVYCKDCEHAHCFGNDPWPCGVIVEHAVFNEFNGKVLKKEVVGNLEMNKSGDCEYYKRASFGTRLWRIL